MFINLSMKNQKAISIPIKDISQLKVVLAAWYAYLRDTEELSREELTECLKTPVIYNLEDDKIELMFTGSSQILDKFKNHVNQA